MEDVGMLWGWLAGAIAVVGTTLAVVLGRSTSSTTSPPTTDPTKPTDPKPTSPDIDTRPTELDAFGVPFARGVASPLWPIAGDMKSRPANLWARGRVTADFGAGRPSYAATFTRHHAGEDLRGPPGTSVVATERGRIISIDDDWQRGRRDDGSSYVTGAVLVAFDSGFVGNFGEVEPGSTRALGFNVGTVVERGDVLARVGESYMLHFETYVAGTTRSHQWPWGAAPPSALLDPTQYLALAAATVPA